MEFCIRLLVYIIIVYMNEYDWIALADDCLRIHRRKTQSHNTNKMLDLSSLWPKTIANGISGIGAYIECECKSTGLCEDDAILFLTIHMFECKPKTQWILYSNVYNNDVVTHLFYAFVLLLKHILYNKRCAISWVWSLLFWCRNINHQYSLVVLCIHIQSKRILFRRWAIKFIHFRNAAPINVTSNFMTNALFSANCFRRLLLSADWQRDRKCILSIVYLAQSHRRFLYAYHI